MILSYFNKEKGAASEQAPQLSCPVSVMHHICLFCSFTDDQLSGEVHTVLLTMLFPRVLT